jgi:hypothetical protein
MGDPAERRGSGRVEVTARPAGSEPVSLGALDEVEALAALKPIWHGSASSLDGLAP